MVCVILSQEKETNNSKWPLSTLDWALVASELGRVLWLRCELTVSAQRPLPASLRSSTAWCHAAALDPGSRFRREPTEIPGIFQGMGILPVATRPLYDYERQPSALNPALGAAPGLQVHFSARFPHPELRSPTGDCLLLSSDLRVKPGISSGPTQTCVGIQALRPVAGQVT